MVISGLVAFVGATGNSTQSDSTTQSSHNQENHAVIIASVVFLMIPTVCGVGGLSLLAYRYKQHMQKKKGEQKKHMVICYQDEEADINIIPFQTQMFTSDSSDDAENPVHASTVKSVENNKLPSQTDSTELSISTADTVNLYFLTFQAWLQSPPKFSLTSTVDHANTDHQAAADIEQGCPAKEKKMMSAMTTSSSENESRVSWMPKLRMPRLMKQQRHHDSHAVITQQPSFDTAENSSIVSDLTLTPPFGEEELETVDWLDEDVGEEEEELQKKENGFRRWLNTGSSRKRSASYTLRI